MHPMESEELMAYLDGELTPARAAAAAEHLGQCRECQAVAADVESVSRRLLEWQVEDAGPRVERAVNAARVDERKHPAWKWGVHWAVGLAAPGLLLVIVMTVTKPRQEVVRLAQFAALQRPVAESSAERAVAGLVATDQAASVDAARTGEALVIRTAQITLTTPDFTKARVSLEDILKRHGGHIGNLTLGSPADSGQTLQATLRVPASRLDACLAEIRKLGRVESEQQGGEEVTQQVVDLEARLGNARNTEQRLADILRRSTGKIMDVLAVEKEIDRVRGEIERMQAERKGLADRIDFATLEVRVNEEYKAHLAVAAPSAFSRLRNAAVEGYRNVADSLTGAAMFLLAYGPGLLLWGALLFFPVRYAWRRLRKISERR
jgi:predicted anti-sigma-YlaC factor YlaD